MSLNVTEKTKIIGDFGHAIIAEGQFAAWVKIALAYHASGLGIFKLILLSAVTTKGRADKL